MPPLLSSLARNRRSRTDYSALSFVVVLASAALLLAHVASLAYVPPFVPSKRQPRLLDESRKSLTLRRVVKVGPSADSNSGNRTDNGISSQLPYSYLKSLVPQLYPTIMLERSSIARPITTKLENFFDEAMAKVVDIVVTKGADTEGKNMKGTILYALAALPTRLKIAAQVMPRRLYGLTRVRVIRNFEVKGLEDALVMKVAADTDPDKLVEAMKFHMVRGFQNETSDLKRTVQLEFIGGKAASQVMIAIEELFWQARNEITFIPSFFEFSEDGKASIIVSVTLN